MANPSRTSSRSSTSAMALLPAGRQWAFDPPDGVPTVAVFVEADCPCAPRQVSVTRWEPADAYVCLIGPVASEIFEDVPSPKSTLPEPLSQDALIRVTPCDWITSRFPEPPEDTEEPIAIAVLPD
jgi:hypothetical protein